MHQILCVSLLTIFQICLLLLNWINDSFRQGHDAYGSITLVLLVAPAFAAVILKKNWEIFIKHLPIAQLQTHQELLNETRKLQNDILKKKLTLVVHQALSDLKGSDLTEFESEQEVIREKEDQIGQDQRKIDQIKTDLQMFKVFGALLESAPQAVFQFSILLKKLYQGQGEDLLDLLVILQITSSMASVFLTFSGLITELPFLVWETDRPPIRTFKFAYLKVLPLVVFAVTPRILSLVAITSFVTLQTWPFFTVYGFCNLVVYGSLCYGIKHWMSKNLPTKANLFNLGLATSLVAPCVIGAFNSKFILMCSIVSSILHCIALGFLRLFGHFAASWIFSPKAIEADKIQEACDSDGNNTDIIETDPISLTNNAILHQENMLWFLNWYMLLIPLLLLSNICYWLIFTFVTLSNDIYHNILAIDSGDKELLQKRMEAKSDFNSRVPGDNNNYSIFSYACAKNDVMGQILINNSKDLGLSLTMKGSDNKTPLMLACEHNHILSIKALIQKGKEQCDIKINDVDSGRNSALHLIALSGSTFDEKQKLFKLMLNHLTEELQVDFMLKNAVNKRPFEILEDIHEMSPYMEIVTPRMEVNLLQSILGPHKVFKEFNILQTLLDRDHLKVFKEYLTAVKKIPKQIDPLFVVTIEDGYENLGVSMIQKFHSLHLRLDHIGEEDMKEKRGKPPSTNPLVRAARPCHYTPLTLACVYKRPKIVEALFQVDGRDHQKIAVNAKCGSDKETAFITACGNSFIEGIYQIMENAKLFGIDLNATNTNGATGFIVAAQNKNDEVMDLIFTMAEKYGIVLNCKDRGGKTAFDYWLPTKQVDFFKKSLLQQDEKIPEVCDFKNSENSREGQYEAHEFVLNLKDFPPLGIEDPT